MEVMYKEPIAYPNCGFLNEFYECYAYAAAFSRTFYSYKNVGGNLHKDICAPIQYWV